MDKSIDKQINELKAQLFKTDHYTLKFIEGKITQEEFDRHCKEREAMRTKIRELENQLKDY